METVNNVVSSATKMIWGEPKPGEEPVNGQTGAGTLNEPYDKGNDDVGKFPSACSFFMINPWRSSIFSLCLKCGKYNVILAPEYKF
jgi:hypothetical protein